MHSPVSLLALSLNIHISPVMQAVLTLALIFTLGLMAQILAEKTEIPAIVFLLLFGAVLGKYGLNLINPDVFGLHGLRAMIAVAVAIVVFEGALMLDIKFFRHHWSSVLGLGTLNVFITLVCMAWITHWILGISFSIALLYAALISVTGPTVIAPILKRLHVSHKVKVILESEAVLVDAVGVIAAVSIFNYILVSGGAPEGMSTALIFKDTVLSLVLGACCGAIVAWCAYLMVNKLGRIRSEQVRLLVFSTAFMSYAIGEIIAHESGIAAVAVAGFMVGNLDFPHKQSIKVFKGTMTLLSITLVFLLLAASLDLQFLMEMGLKGALCVVLLMLAVRPLGVMLSTVFEKISWREKLFIAALGPRGIVAASAATFFAIELDAAGIEGGHVIRGMVFMTVLMTVIIQGSGAKKMANLLNISPDSVLLIGAGRIGRQLIEQIQADGQTSIIVLERDPQVIENLQHLAFEGVYFLNVDARQEAVYLNQLQGLKKIKKIIATTHDDWLNLRVCQIAKRLNPHLQTLALLNDVKGRDVFESLGIQTLNLREAAVTVLHAMMKDPNVVINKDTGQLRYEESQFSLN